MQAYFSGDLPQDRVRIEITYGEETGMVGAQEVAQTLGPTDVVIVVDVTGTRTTSNVVIEKCKNNRLRLFLQDVMKHTDIPHKIYKGCPDGICTMDETDVYSFVTEYTFFLGLPVRGGNYNAGPVYCFKADIDDLSRSLIVITREILNNFTVPIPENLVNE
jgi:hypothetical protein